MKKLFLSHSNQQLIPEKEWNSYAICTWWKMVLQHRNTFWLVGLRPFSCRGVKGRLPSQNHSYYFTFSPMEKLIHLLVFSVFQSQRTHRGSSILKVFSNWSEQRCVQTLQSRNHGGTVLHEMLLFLLELLYLLYHFSHFRAVFCAEQNFWTYAWKIHKTCDKTLIAERNVCDAIRRRGKGTLPLLDVSGFRLCISNAGAFRIFPWDIFWHF